ncbi:MAG: dienelactone hydrolase family protein [Candidatus Eremiobacteraeota bacterium]|nr:dienelactone hydrolase family protein [Candidatus Eremiobacteraeota bacterium]
MPESIDPTTPSDAAFTRRVFVGMGAGSAALVSNPGLAALAEDQGFGKPHPPIVAENDPEIVVTRETLEHGGRRLDAYAALPKRDPVGSVVVILHIWGIDANIRDIVRRFAKEGYVTIAPDLFAGLGAPDGDNTTDYAPFREVASKLSRETVDADIRAAADWARTPPPVLRLPTRTLRVAITGFCMGGAIALRQTVGNAAGFSAASIWYGAVKDVDPTKVRVPILGSYGGRDTGIPADEVRTFYAALPVPHDLKVYDEAGHAFFDDTRPSYVASAASDAWPRTLGWFRRYLSAS